VQKTALSTSVINLKRVKISKEGIAGCNTG
jgi:hypothetical protein